MAWALQESSQVGRETLLRLRGSRPTSGRLVLPTLDRVSPSTQRRLFPRPPAPSASVVDFGSPGVEQDQDLCRQVDDELVTAALDVHVAAR